MERDVRCLAGTFNQGFTARDGTCEDNDALPERGAVAGRSLALET